MTDPFTRDMDRILVTGVRARGFHGVLSHERETGQEFVVDVALGVMSIAKSARSDDMRHTVDYGTIATEIVAIVEGPPVNLLETLATRIADRCLKFDFVRAVQVTVHKPNAPLTVPFQDVAVCITRSQ